MKALKHDMRTTLLAVTTLLIAVFGATANAASIYVNAATGNNSNNCTSYSLACKTITAAIGKAASGDTVLVEAGTYNERVVVPSTKDNMTIRARVVRQPLPIIDGNVAGGTYLPGNWQAMVTLDGDYATLLGFEIRNSNSGGKNKDGGYGVQSAGHHNTIKSNYIHDTWATGIYMEGDFGIVDSNRVYRTNTATGRSIVSPNFHNQLYNAEHPSAPITWTTTSGELGWGQAIMCANNNRPEALDPVYKRTSYCTVSNNVVYDNWSEGLGCFNARYCTFTGNTAFDNMAEQIYLSDATNSIIEENIVYRSSSPLITDFGQNAGLTLADERADKPRSTDNIVRNNMVVNSAFFIMNWSLSPTKPGAGLKNTAVVGNTIVNSRVAIGMTDGQNVNSIIKDNIFDNAGITPTYNMTSGITLSHNAWRVAPANAGTNNISADPMVTKSPAVSRFNVRADFFKLLPGSPAANAGTFVTGMIDDAFGTLRGDTFDMGAHEVSP